MPTTGPITTRRVAIVASVVVALVAGAALTAWLFGAPDVIAVVSLRMKANTAAALLAAALALAARLRGWHLCASTFALLVIAVAGATVVEYAAGVDLGIDQLIAADIPAPESALYPNRMSPNAA